MFLLQYVVQSSRELCFVVYKDQQCGEQLLWPVCHSQRLRQPKSWISRKQAFLRCYSHMGSKESLCSSGPHTFGMIVFMHSLHKVLNVDVVSVNLFHLWNTNQVSLSGNTLTCIWEMPDSDLGWDTDYLDWGGGFFWWFATVCPGKCQLAPCIRPDHIFPHLGNSLFTVIQWFDTVQSNYWVCY